MKTFIVLFMFLFPKFCETIDDSLSSNEAPQLVINPQMLLETPRAPTVKEPYTLHIAFTLTLPKLITNFPKNKGKDINKIVFTFSHFNEKYLYDIWKIFFLFNNKYKEITSIEL